MAFVQTIGFTSSRIEEMQKLMDEWGEQAASSSPGFVGSKVLQDRDNQNAFMVVAEFESHELAMENSNRPETDARAKQMAELCDAPPTFGNYDVIHTESAS